MPEIVKNYKNFIGIDIGKQEFVVAEATTKTTKAFSNSLKGFELFFKEYKSLLNDECLVILETTGGYEKALIYYILDKNISLHRANTRQVKSYTRSLGVIAKSDAIDAGVLVSYGMERYPKLSLYKAPDNSADELRKLLARRADLIHMQTQEKNRLQAPDSCSDVIKDIKAVLRVLHKNIEKIDALVEDIINSSKELTEKVKVLTSIPGIGKKTAVGLLGAMPEMGKLNSKTSASLAGLAPHPYESGMYKGYRKVRGGRKNVKPILFLSALTAARSKSRLGAHYKKLIANGKKPIVAITVLMRKIIVIANAKIRELISGVPCNEVIAKGGF